MSKNKIKDVITLKTAKENFFKNDGSLQQWLAHGATEAANMVLHGHPAPVYAGNVSPPNQVSTSEPTAQVESQVPEQETVSPQEPAQDNKSFLMQTMEEIHQHVEIEDPEMEIDQ